MPRALSGDALNINGIQLQRFVATLTRSLDLSRLVITITVAALVTYSILARGVPALQHDWWFPHDSAAMRSVVHWYADGWSPYGFGSPQPYPTFYPLVPFWYLFSCNFMPFVGLAACIFATSCLSISSAIALLEKKRWFLTFPLAVAAAANPWVYNEYRAGHVYMVTAYAVVLALFVEIRRAQPRDWALCILASLSILQIEFSALLTIPFSIWLIVNNRMKPLLVLWAFLAPIVYGICSSYGLIHETPYGVDWQAAESIHLLDGLLMRGYGSDAVHFSSVQTTALSVFGLLGIYGIFVCLKDRFERGLVAVAFLLTIYASGLSDFFGPAYLWLVLHIRETGLFRELYDLIAIQAIAYIVLLAAAFRRISNIGFIGSVAACLLLMPWILSPISRAIVPIAAIPQITLPQDDQRRVLLLPAFQPMSFVSEGSGTDPDAFVSSNASTPLNEWFPSFPVNTALAHAEHDQDYRQAQALGVRDVLARPYLATNREALSAQGVDVESDLKKNRPSVIHLADSMPLLSLISIPSSIVSVGNDPREHAVFFGDLMPGKIDTFASSLLTHDAQKAWIDARVGVLTHPDEGSKFGGVVTTGKMPLQMPHRSAVLAQVHGRLLDDAGRVIALTSNTLHWYTVAPYVKALYCDGRCNVVLAGDPPPLLAEHAYVAHRYAHDMHVDMKTAWLGATTIWPNKGGVLRFNNRYDNQWYALCGSKLLKHFPLDTIVNAWEVPASTTPQRVILFHFTSCVQAVLELLAALILILCLRSTIPDTLPRRP